MVDSTEHSEEALTAMREAILAKLAEIGADEHGELIGDLRLPQGFADAGAAAADRSELLGRAQRLVARLGRVNEALGHVDAGNYGVCDECGEPISAERLEFRPTSVLCVSCKSAS